jgi:small nuclear ribonucleoprotein (snRNP)-like protein
LCAVALNANRHVSGVLRGFDQFMNIVLDNAVDEKNKTDIGMVVSPFASQEYQMPTQSMQQRRSIVKETAFN